jgi:hypothetical protein
MMKASTTLPDRAGSNALGRTTMNTSSRLGRTMVCAVVALLATGALAACNPNQTRAAAIIDGKVISTDELQAATQSYLQALGNPDDKQAQRLVLQQMVLTEVIEKAAKDQGVAVRTGTVASQRDRVIKSIGGKVALVKALAQQQQPTTVAPTQIDSWVRGRLLSNKILAKIDPGGDPTSQVAAEKFSTVLVKASKSMKIELNPRYGTWSPTRGVTPLISGGLSKTAAQLK